MDGFILLNELTLPQLQKATVDAFPDTTKRQHSTDQLHVNNPQFIVQEGALLIKCNVNSTKPGKTSTYDTAILFDGVDVFASKVGNSDLLIKGTDGEEWYLPPVDTSKYEVKVKCNCMDFRWRFADWNANNDSLFGNAPEPYVKKTDRPPVNPKQSPGMCKHLLATVDALANSKIIY